MLLTADERPWGGWHAADFELKVQVRADRETRAAYVANLLSLLHFLSQSHAHLRHVGVDLDEAEAVGDLDPDPEVVCGTGGSHSPTGSRDDRRAVAREYIDPCVEMQITAKGRLERERRRSKWLD